jgi:RNA polymerase sigma-54 factor
MNDGASSTNLSNWQNTDGKSFNEGGDEDFESRATTQKTLREHVMDQIAVDLEDPGDRVIATHLLDMLDDAGYFRGDVRDIAQTLECAPERVMFTLLRLQQLDPAGIFARDLSECLALQLRDKNRLDPIMQRFLQHLDLLGSHRIQELQKVCEVDMEDLRDMIAEIKTLNPKPGEAFSREEAQPIIPDIIMKPQKGGGWHIELNSETLPRVLINNRYYTQVKNGVKDKEEKKYLAEKFQMANWLVKAMHQRATTILKVAAEIVGQQESFFNYGVEYLRPLVRREIAEKVELHESTVSRVTTNKYIQTPRGIFELRYFFTSGIASSTGGMTHSAESVRHRIKALIEAEPPAKPISDDKLVTILVGEGIDVARRTVAKYREQLNIPSSADRRRQKSIKI